MKNWGNLNVRRFASLGSRVSGTSDSWSLFLEGVLDPDNKRDTTLVQAPPDPSPSAAVL